MTEPQDQTPALSPEEWQTWDEAGECDRLDWCRRYHDEIKLDAGYSGRDRQAVAALCLHGQPFGFTQEDVTALHWAVDGLVIAADEPLGQHDEFDAASMDRLRSLASRIAALLPPQT